MNTRRKAACVDTLRVSMLGAFSMELGGVIMTDDVNRSQKLWNVLSYLLLHRGRTVSQSELIDVFWPEEDSVNPGNALKTLLFRIRAMLEPLFGAGVSPIISQRGAYIWNEAIPCRLDCEEFEELCLKAADRSVEASERINLYRRAVELFKGDLLPKLATQVWVVPLAAHYHNAYVEAVKALATLLEANEAYDEMEAVCSRASGLDPLDESLHILVLRSLIRQGKEAAALSHYTKTTDMLYRNLGVRPSEELRKVYTEIMRSEKDLETDLEVIQRDLKETCSRPGAFVCEYGFFREVYRLEARRCLRNGTSVHVALATISLPDGGIPPLKVLASAMEQLENAFIETLRRGDIVSKFSGAQYVVMLPSANYEDSNMVMERVTAAFYRHYRRNYLKLSCKIRELEID